MKLLKTMKQLSILTILALTVFIALPAINPASAGPAEDQAARDILNKVDDLYRGDSSHGTMTMEVVTENWSRTMTMEFWTKGKDKSLYRILSPTKEAGTATLRSGNDIWNFLPKVDRSIKIPSSMMSESWMGSHITNDDLVKESRMADDYDFTVSFEGVKDGQEVIEITCIPIPDAAVVWGELIVRVLKKDYVPLGIDYYDEGMALARTLAFSDPMDIGDRVVQSTVTVIPADKPGESTYAHYDSITFDVTISDDFFSLRELQK